MKIDKVFFIKTLIEAAATVEGVSIRSYSGRGMCGDRCIGLDGNREDCRAVFTTAILGQLDAIYDGDGDGNTLREAHQFVSTLMNHSSDSMGLGVIYYWPNIEYDDVDEEPDDI